jgi:hypothetical protein
LNNLVGVAGILRRIDLGQRMNHTWNPEEQRQQAVEQGRTDPTGEQHRQWWEYEAKNPEHPNLLEPDRFDFIKLNPDCVPNLIWIYAGFILSN